MPSLEDNPSLEALIIELKSTLQDAQVLYNELYDMLAGEAEWESCKELQNRYPQYEINRPKDVSPESRIHL